MAEEKSGKVDVTQEEMEIAFSGPALYCNKFYVTMSPVNMRLTFAENNPRIKLPQFRGAVSMSIGDAMELKALLERVLEDVETHKIKIPKE